MFELEFSDVERFANHIIRLNNERFMSEGDYPAPVFKNDINEIKAAMCDDEEPPLDPFDYSPSDEWATTDAGGWIWSFSGPINLARHVGIKSLNEYCSRTHGHGLREYIMRAEMPESEWKLTEDEVAANLPALVQCYADFLDCFDDEENAGSALPRLEIRDGHAGYTAGSGAWVETTPADLARRLPLADMVASYDPIQPGCTIHDLIKEF